MIELTKRDVVNGLKLGDYVAEDETENLESYFIHTQQWNDVESGEADIVLGLKGSGKSAIFSLLSSQAPAFAERGTILRLGENLDGDPVFSVLLGRTPKTAREWEGLWKLYFLSIAAGVLKERGINDDASRRVLSYLESEGLVGSDMTPASIIRRVLDYIFKKLRLEGLESGIHLNEQTGAVSGVYAKVLIARSDVPKFPVDSVVVDDLIGDVNACLTKNQLRLWLLLDRLDSVFKREPDIERHALKSLLIVYKDHFRNRPFRLKLFLRTEAYEEILRRGFAEATHITKKTALIWTPKDTADLVIKRFCNSDEFITFYNIDRQDLSEDFQKKKVTLNSVFEKSLPRIIKGPFDKILDRLEDGQGHVAPRDAIMFLKFCRKAEQTRYHRGEPPVGVGPTLFHPESVMQALAETSKTKLVESVYAEYPELAGHISKLGKMKKQPLEVQELSKLWGKPLNQGNVLATRMRDIGLLGASGHDPVLYTVGKIFCPELGITVPF